MKDKNLKGKELEKYKETLKLEKSQRYLIIGTLMGDASMSLTYGKPVYSIKFEQKILNKDYINFIYYKLEPFIGMTPKIRLIKSSGKFKERESIWFRTYRHDSFKFYFDLFYKIEEGKLKKKLPENFHRYLNAEVLAYWYMDDGNKHSAGFVLNTQNFTYNENKELALILEKVFKFTKVSLWKDKEYYKLYIGAADRDFFLDLVKPFILPIFLYKLGL